MPPNKSCRTFNGHAGRILEMQLMQERGHNVFITNSMDKTIRVWDVDNVLEVVHPLDRMEARVDKLILCERANLVMSVTRTGLGFWNLTTGALDFIEADMPAGGEQIINLHL